MLHKFNFLMAAACIFIYTNKINYTLNLLVILVCVFLSLQGVVLEIIFNVQVRGSLRRVKYLRRLC